MRGEEPLPAGVTLLDQQVNEDPTAEFASLAFWHNNDIQFKNTDKLMQSP